MRKWGGRAAGVGENLYLGGCWRRRTNTHIVSSTLATPNLKDSFRHLDLLAAVLVTFTCVASHANLWPMTKGWMDLDRRTRISIS